MDDFLRALEALPIGYSQGLFEGRRYGTTLNRSADGKRIKLFAEELGGDDHISFNLYRLRDQGARLKPCEMPKAKVIAFVIGYAPEQSEHP